MASNSVDTHKQDDFQPMEEDGGRALPLQDLLIPLPITPLPSGIPSPGLKTTSKLSSPTRKPIQRLFSQSWIEQLWTQRQFMLALLASFFGGVFLFSSTIANLASIIINVGLDPLRAQLIAALILMAGAALIGAGLGRRKLGAIVGAGFVFYYSYLTDFIQTELKPFHDPGGLLEPLNSTALLHTSWMMMALALLCAFIGAAVGANLAEVFVDPLYQLCYSGWQRLRSGGFSAARQPYKDEQLQFEQWFSQGIRPDRRTATMRMIGRWLGMATMILLVLLASGSGDLFIFSPDVGLHTPPKLPTLPSTSGTPGTPGATIVPAVSKIVKDSLISPVLGKQKRFFMVYLPPSYNTPAGKTRHYPVLYFLHGSPGSDTDGFTGAKLAESADTLIAIGKIPELIMILPDGNGRAGATSEWGNSFDGKQNIETYLANELVPYVDQHYRTIPDPGHRAISGISMGGFGAMNIAIHHPDIFGTTIPLGGYYHAEGSIWGNKATCMRQNSPATTILTAPQAWTLHIFLGAATKDQPYYTYTKQFAQELDQLHILYTFDLENGYHSWTVWQTQMYKALLWISWDGTVSTIRPSQM